MMKREETLANSCNSEAALLNQKISGPVLVVHAISSLDDGIDFANQSTKSTLAASYIFAALPEANYLASFVDAHLSCINHIPAELLGMNRSPSTFTHPLPVQMEMLRDKTVGPIAPLPHTPSLSPRYTQAMFQEPRPQLLHKTTLTSLLSRQPQHESSTANNTPLADLKTSLEAPLPPINRKKGKDVPFFLQAIMTGGIVLTMAVAVTVGATAKYVILYARRRL